MLDLPVMLSVDWDFFFPEPAGSTGRFTDGPWDWGHSEHWSDSIMSQIWGIRAGEFPADKLPMCSGYESFWSKFDLSRCTEVIISDSHGNTLNEEVMRHYSHVVNYDAHHDCGYSHDPIEMNAGSCDNWLWVYLDRCAESATVVYPEWKDRAFDVEPFTLMEAVYGSCYGLRRIFESKAEPVQPDVLFVCRSGAWVPPWCDDQFEEFVNLCGLPRKIVTGIGSDYCGPRSYKRTEFARIREELLSFVG